MKIDFSTMTNDEVAASLAKTRERATALFALTAPSVDEANETDEVMASIAEHEAFIAERDAEARTAGEKFAANKAAFAAAEAEAKKKADAEKKKEEDAKKGKKAKPFAAADDSEGDADDEGDEGDEDGDDSEDDTTDEADADAEGDDEGDEGDEDGDDSEVVTASGSQRAKVPASKRVGRKTKRPVKAATSPVTITAGADITGFSTGQALTDMSQVGAALLSRAKGFAPYNAAAAKAVRKQSEGQPVINKVGLATLGVPFSQALVASGSTGSEYNAVRNAIKEHEEALTASMAGDGVLTAAGWCAPSETVYSYISDYVVDGLVTVPEVSAPRGGLMLTTGPAKSNDVDDFGFVQTEAQAEAGQVKPLETIECPEFVDHRLDAIGYGFTIPLLTQKAYPELITDALKFASVLYAHKINRRVLSDMAALSDAATFEGYGPSVTDTLEALCIIAVKERRWWNIGENAVMEVKVPVWAKEVFRADMSRRAGLALSDIATDEKINAEFTARRLAVEYVADWQELTRTAGGPQVLPGTFQVMIYPQGTFIKAVEDVVNLSAIYDAASITVNEYTGVFFEQGILVAKAGYGSTKVTIPVNTAGETGAHSLTGAGDATENGSF